MLGGLALIAAATEIPGWWRSKIGQKLVNNPGKPPAFARVLGSI
jgi:hypothetical protein